MSEVGFEPGTFRSCVEHSIRYATETPPIPDVLLVLVAPKYINRNVTTTLQSRFTPSAPPTGHLVLFTDPVMDLAQKVWTLPIFQHFSSDFLSFNMTDLADNETTIHTTDALCCKRSQQPADDRSTEVTARLHVFEPASPSDVKRIVMSSAAKSCVLDPLPTSFLKTHIDFLCPVLARIINTSLSSAVVPRPMKHAVVTPILKKRCSDVNILTNYRPISNITFVAKITERFVAQQLQRFMDVNGIYGVYQSAYRPQHSAETALLRIHNDVAQSIDSRRSVLLVLLDLTAAFDTIDHNILPSSRPSSDICYV